MSVLAQEYALLTHFMANWAEQGITVVALLILRVSVFQGKLVYANQGKPSDYKLLNETLDLKGTIAITRYGGAGRADKVSVVYR